MLKRWFQAKCNGKMKRRKQVKFYGDEAVHSRYYVNGRYGSFIFPNFRFCFNFNIQVFHYSTVLPSDASIIYGQKTLYIYPKREQNLDWLYELEADDEERNKAEQTDYDLCCCPFLKITSKSLKSKTK